MKRVLGFTLLELLIMVAIVATLLMVAVPSYRVYVRKGRRTDGIQSINALRLAEEKYRSMNNQYGTLVQVQSLANIPLSSYYTFTITSIGATTYTITADPIGDQANDAEGGTSCDPLVFAVSGTTETKTPAACWPD